MSSLRIKVCGMREPENILRLAALQPDMMGFIFYPKSSRFVGEALSPEELCSLNVEADKVGVFVNASIDEIVMTAKAYALDGVQLHGTETATFCAQIQACIPDCYVCKAFGVDESFDFSRLRAYAPICSYFLFDTQVPEYGGSGRSFDWSLLEQYEEFIPFYLAGGIGVEEIPAIRALSLRENRLLGIDINSRVELAPGRKSIEQVTRVIQELRS